MANFVDIMDNDGIGMVINEDQISAVKEVEGGCFIHMVDGATIPMTTENYPADVVYGIKARFLGARKSY